MQVDSIGLVDKQRELRFGTQERGEKRIVPANLTVTCPGSGTACNKERKNGEWDVRMEDWSWLDWRVNRILTGTDPWTCWLSMVVYFPDIILIFPSSSPSAPSLSLSLADLALLFSVVSLQPSPFAFVFLVFYPSTQAFSWVVPRRILVTLSIPKRIFLFLGIFFIFGLRTLAEARSVYHDPCYGPSHGKAQ